MTLYKSLTSSFNLIFSLANQNVAVMVIWFAKIQKGIIRSMNHVDFSWCNCSMSVSSQCTFWMNIATVYEICLSQCKNPFVYCSLYSDHKYCYLTLFYTGQISVSIYKWHVLFRTRLYYAIAPSITGDRYQHRPPPRVTLWFEGRGLATQWMVGWQTQDTVRMLWAG